MPCWLAGDISRAGSPPSSPLTLTHIATSLPGVAPRRAMPANSPGAVTAILTNPIWVVKVPTFPAPPNSPAARRGLWSGFRAIFRDEFMAYEKRKSWAFERKRRWVSKLGRAWTTDDNELVYLRPSSATMLIGHRRVLLGLSSNIADDRSFSDTSFVTTLT
ncbi:hypothetical protein EDB84DRAFT_1575449 [Lactarius hengduanensis]|nr:hypothetical protein EDB84DRAFT_1575449 [Lactarius hengduanensis]